MGPEISRGRRKLPPLTEPQLEILSENFKQDSIGFDELHVALWGNFPGSTYIPEHPPLKFGDNDELQMKTSRTRRSISNFFRQEPVYEAVAALPSGLNGLAQGK